MITTTEYALLDFGRGRKLERFGPYVLDRPSPAAAGRCRCSADLWQKATAVYQRPPGRSGRWVRRAMLPDYWHLSCGRLQLELKATPFGHVGVFPEQFENWDWIGRQVEGAGRRLQVLNLFAYTGGSTLAAAAAGAHVVHVDGAANVVQWARRNAERSQLGAAPIRWIVEDVRKFVRRQQQQGRTYDAIIVDPPAYGHGPQGEVWQLRRDLAGLLHQCAELTGPGPAFVLLTCHDPRVGPADMQRMLSEVWGTTAADEVEAGPLALVAHDGRRLPSGWIARFSTLCPRPLASEAGSADA